MNRLRHHVASFASIGVRGLSVLAGFGISWWLGHVWGPAANGQYALVTQTAMFLSVVAVGGLDLAVVREFSRTVALDRALSRGTLVRLLLLSLALSAILVIGLLGVGDHQLERWLGERLPTASLLVLCVLLAVRALTRMTSAVLRSQKRYVLGQVVEVLLIPLLVLAVLLTGTLRSVDALLVATAAAGLAVAAGGVVAALFVTDGGYRSLSVPLAGTLRTAGPLWGVALALNFGDWFGLAVAASLEGVFEAGLYRVALQIASALAIVSMGLFGVYAPRIGAAFAAEDRVEVGRLTRTATRLSVVLMLPAAAILVIAAEPILRLLGPEFIAGAQTLRILTVGQAIYSATGPAGLTLAMAGHGKVNLWITGASVLALLALAPLGSALDGIEGIAVAVSLLLVVRNVASLVAVQRLTGVNVLTGQVEAPTGVQLETRA